MSRSRNSSVGVVTKLWAECPGLVATIWTEQEIYLFSNVSRRALRPTQSTLLWVLSMLSLGVMQPQHETDHSHSSSVEVKNEWSYTPPPPYALMAGTGRTLSVSYNHHGSNKHTVNISQRHWWSLHAYTCGNSLAHPDRTLCSDISQPDLKL